MLNILNLSGGKDSTALAIESKRRGLKFDYIVYAEAEQRLDELENEYIKRNN